MTVVALNGGPASSRRLGGARACRLMELRFVESESTFAYFEQAPTPPPIDDTNSIQAAKVDIDANSWRVVTQYGNDHWVPNTDDYVTPNDEVIPPNTSTHFLVMMAGVLAAQQPGRADRGPEQPGRQRGQPEQRQPRTSRPHGAALG